MDDTTREKIRKLIRDLEHYKGGTTSDTFQRPLMAEIQLIIADEQAKSADKLERQTERLVEETVELRRLTGSLYFLTIAVAGFALMQIIIMLLEYCAKLHGSP